MRSDGVVRNPKDIFWLNFISDRVFCNNFHPKGRFTKRCHFCLHCCEKFEGTPSEKVVNLSNLTKSYFICSISHLHLSKNLRKYNLMSTLVIEVCTWHSHQGHEGLISQYTDSGGTKMKNHKCSGNMFTDIDILQWKLILWSKILKLF